MTEPFKVPEPSGLAVRAYSNSAGGTIQAGLRAAYAVDFLPAMRAEVEELRGYLCQHGQFHNVGQFDTWMRARFPEAAPETCPHTKVWKPSGECVECGTQTGAFADFTPPDLTASPKAKECGKMHSREGLTFICDGPVGHKGVCYGEGRAATVPIPSAPAEKFGLDHPQGLAAIEERLNGAMSEPTATQWRYEVISALLAEVRRLHGWGARPEADVVVAAQHGAVTITRCPACDQWYIDGHQCKLAKITPAEREFVRTAAQWVLEGNMFNTFLNTPHPLVTAARRVVAESEGGQ